MAPEFPDDEYEGEARPEPPSKRRDSSRQIPGKGGLNFRDDDEDEREEEPETPARKAPRADRSAGSQAPPSLPPRKLNLVDLAAPVFAVSATLPRDPGQDQPDYGILRGEAMTVLQTFERESAALGIDPTDVQEASYALAVFFDEAVNRSEWIHRIAWGQEPLGVVLHNDPIGGVNFYERLKRLGGRRPDLHEVFFACLTLGFRGVLANDEPGRRRIIEDELAIIRPRPVLPNKKIRLFPDGYHQAPDLDVVGKDPPKWWWPLSIVLTVAAIGLYIYLFTLAASAPRKAEGVIKQINASHSTGASTPPHGGDTTASGR